MADAPLIHLSGFSALATFLSDCLRTSQNSGCRAQKTPRSISERTRLPKGKHVETKRSGRMLPGEKTVARFDCITKTRYYS
jgi:hypothetical protein